MIRCLAARPMAGAVLLLALCGGGMIVVCLLTGAPVPRVYDEFAYLLTGETFAEGRLTNPTHPHWRHFETFEVIHQPTYQAKYPPGQGLFLAIGMVFGHPIIGVWLSVLLMVGATFWALRALLEAGWAFAGTLLLVLHLSIASYWAQSYWGGAVAAGGGALAFGTAARFVIGRLKWRHGLLGGLGIVLLANSRPLEGLVLTVAVACWIGVAAVRRRSEAARHALAVGACMVVVLAGLTLTGIYNHTVTGSALELPYMVHEKTYALAPFLTFISATTSRRDYVHEEIERQHVTRGIGRHERLRREGVLMTALRRAPGLLQAVGGSGLLLLLALPLAWHRRGVRFAVAACGLLVVMVLLTPAAHPHYLAPAIGPLYFLFAASAAALSQTLEGRAWRLGIVAIIMGLSVVRLATQAGDRQVSRSDWAHQRMELHKVLGDTPKRDLVFVHYPEDYEPRIEWVYNQADIDDAAVIWARPIDAEADAAIVRYYESRRVWNLRIGKDGRALSISRRPASSRESEQSSIELPR